MCKRPRQQVCARLRCNNFQNIPTPATRVPAQNAPLTQIWVLSATDWSTIPAFFVSGKLRDDDFKSMILAQD